MAVAVTFAAFCICLASPIGDVYFQLLLTNTVALGAR